MEKYGKSGPQGRKIFPFRTKKAPSGFREPFRKAEKRRRMRDGVPSISFQKAAAVGGCPFKTAARTATAYGVFFQNSSITPLTA